MSTNFDKNFGPGNITSAQHIQQIFQPIEDIESGKSMFRVATSASTADKYVVDFRQSANPGGHRLTGLGEGQLIIFKATLSCNAGADLEVLHDDGTDTVPLTASGVAIGQGAIQAGQILAVLFNSEGGGRFDILNVSPSTSFQPSSPVLSALADGSGDHTLIYTTANITNGVVNWHDVYHSVSGTSTNYAPAISQSDIIVNDGGLYLLGVQLSAAESWFSLTVNRNGNTFTNTSAWGCNVANLVIPVFLNSSDVLDVSTSATTPWDGYFWLLKLQGTAT